MDQGRLKELVSYDAVSGLFTWNSSGKIAGWKDKKYSRIRLDNKLYLQHRLVWLYVYGAWPTDQLDHLDRDGFNNRLDNLRECSNQINQHNRNSTRNGTSKFIGVYWNSSKGKWVAKFKFKGKEVFYKAFSDELDAHKAYENIKALYIT